MTETTEEDGPTDTFGHIRNGSEIAGVPLRRKGDVESRGAIVAESLDAANWDTLLRRVSAGDAIPFIGAGVSPHPKGTEIARDWATRDKYPLADCEDLARVAQFLAVNVDRTVPRERILDLFRRTPEPDYSDPYEGHRILADLPLPLYITTNYDPFMTEALTAAGRSPKRLISNWNGKSADFNADQMETKSPKNWPSPTIDRPWVFHLHGADVVRDSMVITEDDYLDFLTQLQPEPNGRTNKYAMLPSYVVGALSSKSLLFAGYSLADWTFKVLFRGIRTSMPGSATKCHYALQLPRRREEQTYLARYFEKDMDVKVYWGEKEEFFRELRDRLHANAANV
jgi:SIR2-like domain